MQIQHKKHDQIIFIYILKYFFIVIQCLFLLMECL